MPNTPSEEVLGLMFKGFASAVPFSSRERNYFCCRHIESLESEYFGDDLKRYFQAKRYGFFRAYRNAISAGMTVIGFADKGPPISMHLGLEAS